MCGNFQSHSSSLVNIPSHACEGVWKQGSILNILEVIKSQGTSFKAPCFIGTLSALFTPKFYNLMSTPIHPIQCVNAILCNPIMSPAICISYHVVVTIQVSLWICDYAFVIMHLSLCIYHYEFVSVHFSLCIC
jgi:hypothetical protein